MCGFFHHEGDQLAYEGFVVAVYFDVFYGHLDGDLCIERGKSVQALLQQSLLPGSRFFLIIE